MRRLTLHENDNCSFNIDQDFSMEESKGYWLKNHLDLEESICKLGQHEDIEEELGIDLITLHKALKDGIATIWYFQGKQRISEPTDCYLCFSVKDKEWVLRVGHTYIYTYKLKDYGKTWALTREDLEKGIKQ